MKRFAVERALDGKTIRHDERFLLNPRTPRSSAEARARTVPLEEDTLYLVISPLFGYGIDILQYRIPQSSKLVAVELNAELYDLTLSHANLFGVALYGPSEHPAADERTIASSVVRQPHSDRIRRAIAVRLTGGHRVEGDRYEQLLEILHHEISRRWRNAATRIHFGRKWTRHLLRNISVAAPCASSSPALHTVVICGAGESLEASLPVIRRVQDRRTVSLPGEDGYAIVAVDTALGTLIQYGIVPDIVVALESQVINTGDFAGGIPRRSLLCYDLTVHPSVAQLAAPEQRRPFLTRFADITLLSRIEQRIRICATLAPASSVGMAAIELCRSFGAEKIFLAGFDLAYALGKPHANGTLSHLLYLSTMQRLTKPLLYDHTVERPRERVDPALFAGNNEAARFTEAGMLQQVRYLEVPKHGTQLYTLPRQGPALSIAATTADEFERVVSGRTGHEADRQSSTTTSAYDSSAVPYGNSARELLNEELRRLSALNGGTSLEEIDYLYFDLPEMNSGKVTQDARQPLSSLSSELSRRVHTRAESYKRYIRMLLLQQP